MGFQSFGARQGGDGRSQAPQSRLVQMLHRNHLQEIRHRETAAQARRAAGGQHVVGAGGIIAGGFRAEWSHEHAAGVPHFGQQLLVGNAQVLRREAVGQLHGLIQGPGHHDGGVPRNGLRRHIRRGKAGKLRAHLAGHRRGEALRGGEQDGRGIHVVLRLGQHVGRQAPRVALRRDDHDFRGAGYEIDSHFARQQLLGGGHVNVARAHNAVRFGDRARAEGERRNGMRAAHFEALATPSNSATPNTSSTRRGEAMQMLATPATCAGTTVMMTVEGSG